MYATKRRPPTMIADGLDDLSSWLVTLKNAKFYHHELLPGNEPEQNSSFNSSHNHERNHDKISKHSDTLIVANPASAGGSTGKDWDNFYAEIKDAFGENPKVVFTKKAGDGTILTRNYLKKGFKKVIAIGGDGTINEVANGFFIIEGNQGNKDNPVLVSKNIVIQETKGDFPQADFLKPINSKAIMGIIPSGTRNVLAKSLNLPQGIGECCNNYKQGKIQKLDVLTATVTDPSSHLRVPTRAFRNAAETGFGGEVIDRSGKLKQG
jgi:diacylglycerol kinase (ATP)